MTTNRRKFILMHLVVSLWSTHLPVWMNAQMDQDEHTNVKSVHVVK